MSPETTTHDNSFRGRRSLSVVPQGGFSLVELLAGFLVLLLVLIGLLPIFTRAVIHNVKGKESTEVTNHGSQKLEEHIQNAFNSVELKIKAGSVLTTTDFYTRGHADKLGDEGWTDDATGEIAGWRRTTEIRQLGISFVRDTNLDGVIDEIGGLEDLDYDGYFDNPLPAGTPPNAIHLKEVRVRMLSNRPGIGQGGPTQLTMSSLKAF
jgi:Tfp pilus assembly protein PilV